MREEIKPTAEKNVKWALILGEIAKQNNFDIGNEEISEGFKKIAGNSGTDPDTIRKYYEANNLMDAFRQTLLKEKTLNYLVENANVVEVKSKKKRD